MADSESIIATIINVLTILFEIVVLHVKFWITVIVQIINKFTTEERDVSNDIVLITGAGHGMGKQLALQYSDLGATVVCWDINEKLNNDTVKILKSKGKKAFGYT